MDIKDKFLLFLFLKIRNKTFETKNNNPIKFNFYIPQREIYKKLYVNKIFTQKNKNINEVYYV